MSYLWIKYWRYNILIPKATCNNHRQDESNEDEDIESSLECEKNNDVEGKEKKPSQEKMKEVLYNCGNKKLRKNVPIIMETLTKT